MCVGTLLPVITASPSPRLNALNPHIDGLSVLVALSWFPSSLPVAEKVPKVSLGLLDTWCLLWPISLRGDAPPQGGLVLPPWTSTLSLMLFGRYIGDEINKCTDRTSSAACGAGDRPGGVSLRQLPFPGCASLAGAGKPVCAPTKNVRVSKRNAPGRSPCWH